MVHIRQISGRDQTESKPKIYNSTFFRLILIIFVLFCLLKIWASSRLNTYGDKIQEIAMTTASVELENQLLESQIAQKSSLLSIQELANLYGFTEMKNFQYVQTPKIAAVY